MESLPNEQNQINELRSRIDGMARRLDVQAAQIDKLIGERQAALEARDRDIRRQIGLPR